MNGFRFHSCCSSRALRTFLGLAAIMLASLALHAAAGKDNPVGKPASTSSASASAPARFTYTLQRATQPSDEEEKAYKRITAIMDKAVLLYNQNTTTLHKHLYVKYSPGTPTADGSSNGTIRIGKHINSTATCMHEIAHTLGVGTSPQWRGLVTDGIFTGSHATTMLQELTGNPNAKLHADRMHFWPYGLNYDKEVKSDEDLVRHCKIVEAICRDLNDARKKK